MRPLEKQHLEQVLANFNFRRCRRAMWALRWKWFTLGRTPTADELRQQAAQLLYEAIRQARRTGRSSSATGGLYATATYEAGQLTGLDLKFYTDWFNSAEAPAGIYTAHA